MDFEEAYATREVPRETNSENIVSIAMFAQSDTIDVTQSQDGRVVRFELIPFPCIQLRQSTLCCSQNAVAGL